jgi:hypothetical protein
VKIVLERKIEVARRYTPYDILMPVEIIGNTPPGYHDGLKRVINKREEKKGTNPPPPLP